MVTLQRSDVFLYRLLPHDRDAEWSRDTAGGGAVFLTFGVWSTPLKPAWMLGQTSQRKTYGRGCVGGWVGRWGRDTNKFADLSSILWKQRPFFAAFFIRASAGLCQVSPVPT